MTQKPVRTTLAPPTPELPVEDVERAQQHYRDALGFEIGWLDPGGDIGAVSRDEIAIFFRRRGRPFEPAVHWVFAPDIDATYQELRSRGGRIVEPLEKKPWGLRQFTVEDIDGNRFYFPATDARSGDTVPLYDFAAVRAAPSFEALVRPPGDPVCCPCSSADLERLLSDSRSPSARRLGQAARRAATAGRTGATTTFSRDREEASRRRVICRGRSFADVGPHVISALAGARPMAACRL